MVTGMNIIDLRLKPGTLALYDLPDILYPMPLEAMSGHGELPFALMLAQLQQRAKDGACDWRSLEQALDRLAQLVAPQDPRPVLAAAGEEWWIEVGPVDLTGPIVTIQRGHKLIAAMSAIEGGRLRVATYRPLDAKSAEYIIVLSRRPHPEYGVNMRENNWEYALDCSAGAGNFYAFERGEAHLSYWENGLGFVSDGTKDLNWLVMRDLPCRPPALTLAELGVHYGYS